MEMIIRNARVSGYSDLKDIGIKNGLIANISSSIQAPNCEGYDAKGRFVSPGFIDSHVHLDKSMTATPQTYRHGTILERVEQLRSIKKQSSIESIYDNCVKMAKMMAKHGVLHLRSNVDVDPGAGLKGFQALLQAKKHCQDFIDIQIYAFAQEGIFADPKTQDLLEEALELGSDGIGGHTSIELRSREHVDYIFRTAKKYGVDIDLHVDENSDPDNSLMEYVIDKTMAEGYAGRVNAIHCAALPLMEKEEAKRIIDKAAEVGLNITVCPGTLVLDCPLAPVMTLATAGVNVSLGSDNARDAINPLGSGNPLIHAVILSYLQKLHTESELITLYNMITYNGAKTIGLAEKYGIVIGRQADMVVLDCCSPVEAVMEGSSVKAVFKNGKRLIF